MKNGSEPAVRAGRLRRLADVEGGTEFVIHARNQKRPRRSEHVPTGGTLARTLDIAAGPGGSVLRIIDRSGARDRTPALPGATRGTFTLPIATRMLMQAVQLAALVRIFVGAVLLFWKSRRR